MAEATHIRFHIPYCHSEQEFDETPCSFLLRVTVLFFSVLGILLGAILWKQLTPIGGSIFLSVSVVTFLIALCVRSVEPRKFKYPRPETIREDLIQTTEKLKKENEKRGQKLNLIKQTVMETPELRESFLSCFQETEHILLPPPDLDLSDLVNDPIIEEWRKQRLISLHHDNIETRIYDFLEKNPSFCETFTVWQRKRPSSSTSHPAIEE